MFPKKLPKNVLYYGKDEPPPETTVLRAGPLTMLYQAGDLRYVKFGEHEILRRVYVAIRDHNWGTILPKLSNVNMNIGQDSFQIQYTVENKKDDIDFAWQGNISGDAQGTITFTMHGKARTTFRRNRIGFCILHPMDCAGAACDIEKVDGSIEPSVFPQHIGPQLKIDGIIHPVHPFDNMQAMTHEVAHGLLAQVRFEGDIFEMEDQRNWTDASYKTYSTPLSLPFPVEVPAGTEITQSVTVSLIGQMTTAEVPQSEANNSTTFVIGGEPVGPLPKIGLGVASHGQPLSPKELTRIDALNLSHLRVDLRLSDADYEAKLCLATEEANKLSLKLETALILSDAAEEELQALIQVLEEVKPPLGVWLIFHEAEKTTSEKSIAIAREWLMRYDPTIKIGSGTNVFFTELNCNRPPIHAMDLVCYSLNPQVHAFDNLSLVETLAAQATTVESARQFCEDLPIAVTPVTLQMRFNPNATGPEPEPAPGELPPQVDERQMSLFGAGWTAGSLKYLLESDLESVTYYETSGWRGVMETEAGSAVPERFQSIPGAVFPLYHILADVGDFAEGDIIPAVSSDTLIVDGLVLRQAGRRRVILANLSGERQSVAVHNLESHVTVRNLDETNVVEAMQSPEAFRQQVGDQYSTVEGLLVLDLLPYAVARIDSEL